MNVGLTVVVMVVAEDEIVENVWGEALRLCLLILFFFAVFQKFQWKIVLRPLLDWTMYWLSL